MENIPSYSKIEVNNSNKTEFFEILWNYFKIKTEKAIPIRKLKTKFARGSITLKAVIARLPQNKCNENIP